MDPNQKKNKKRGYNLRPRDSKKKNIVSDNDASSSSDDEDYEPGSEEFMDEGVFKEFLHKLFPSKHLKSQIKEMDAITEKMDKEESKKSKGDKKMKKQNSGTVLKILPVIEDDESQSSSDDSDSDSDSDSDDDYEDDDDEMEAVINIVLNISDIFNEDETESDESESESESESEEINSKKNKKSERKEQESKKSESKKSESRNQEKKKQSQSMKHEKETSSTSSPKNIKSEKELLEKIENAFDWLSPEEKKQSTVFKELEKFTQEQKMVIEKETKKSDKKIKQKNMRDFRGLINERRANNEIAYFNKLTVAEQTIILDKIRESNKIQRIAKPYRFKLLEMDLPDTIKSIAMKKMSTFQKMDPGSGEYFKMKNWIDAFMSIPFNIYENFNISLKKDGPEKCRNFITESAKIMDDAVYGLDDAKMQIMQMIGTWISNPNAIGNAVAIKGPPGTGKTTLVKEGVSKVLKRPFAFLALGGSTDSSFLEGHGYTYEGSTWGKIVSILIQSKCMNPVIYFDELDKVSDTPKGEEIIGILTHLIDTSQNSQFHDKYFSEIDFDLSKCLFIFSYNDESKINPILKDRMYKIETKGYDAKEKAIIAKRHLIPAIRQQIGMSEDDLIITDEVLGYLIQSHTGEEKGVRNLKRCLEMIFTKMNLTRFTDTSMELFKKASVENVTFPYTVTNQDVDKLVTKNEQNPYLATLYT
jgi:ATP-dependent Lon protease